MQHVFEVSTGFGLCGVAAIIERFDIGRVEDRVLLVVDTVAAPEAGRPVHELPEYAPLVARFGRVVDLNDLIAPEHPFGWSPPPGTHHARLATEQLLAAVGIDAEAPHTLWIESIQATVSYSLARLFDRADINVYSDGMMTYGPTRIDVSPIVGHRIRAVYHLDLVPGHAPFLLREYAPAYRSFPVGDFLQALGATTPPRTATGERGPAVLVLGQYLSDLQLLTPEEDSRLLDRMIAVALEAEPDAAVLVRPHPKASATDLRRLLGEHVRQGHDVRLAPSGGLAETLFQDLDVRAVVSCFSTALFTARALGIRTISVGAREVLRTLRPYQNSNRLAIVLADLLHERAALDDGGLEPPVTDAHLIELVIAMTSLSMQPGVLEAWIGRWDEALLALPPQDLAVIRRYVSAARLGRLVPGLRSASAARASGLRRAAKRVPLLAAGWRAVRGVASAPPVHR